MRVATQQSKDPGAKRREVELKLAIARYKAAQTTLKGLRTDGTIPPQYRGAIVRDLRRSMAQFGIMPADLGTNEKELAKLKSGPTTP